MKYAPQGLEYGFMIDEGKIIWRKTELDDHEMYFSGFKFVNVAFVTSFICAP